MAMRDWVQTVIDHVSAWEGVSADEHRFSGTEFNLGKVEIGHIHSNGMVDIPLTRAIRQGLVAAGDALRISSPGCWGSWRKAKPSAL